MSAPSVNDADFLQIERTLPAPRALVYQAFTDPARMLEWFGPHGFSATTVQLDVRVGGAWRGGMRGPDGKERIASGIYREVIPNQRLVFTYAWEQDGARGHETVCEVDLTDAGKHTHLRFTQGRFPSAAEANGHQGGWTEAFEKLAQTVRK
jgi:uncharacterized protein YndB with AHSA1/START domain